MKGIINLPANIRMPEFGLSISVKNAAVIPTPPKLQAVSIPSSGNRKIMDHETRIRSSKARLAYNCNWRDDRSIPIIDQLA